MKSLFKHSRLRRDSNSQSESPLGNVWAHSLTLFRIPESVSVILELHSQTTPFHALAWVASPKLGSWHHSCPTNNTHFTWLNMIRAFCKSLVGCIYVMRLIPLLTPFIDILRMNTLCAWTCLGKATLLDVVIPTFEL